MAVGDVAARLLGGAGGGLSAAGHRANRGHHLAHAVHRSAQCLALGVLMLLRALRAAIQAGHHLIQRADMLDQLAGAGVQMGNKLIERVHQRADFVAPARRQPHGQVAIALRQGVQIVAQMQHLAGHLARHIPGAAQPQQHGQRQQAAQRQAKAARVGFDLVDARGQAVAAVLAQPAQRGLGDVQRGFQRLGMFGGARHVQLAGGHLFRHLVGLGKILGRGLAGLSHISRHAVGVLQSGQRLALLAVQGFCQRQRVGVAGGGGAIEQVDDLFLPGQQVLAGFQLA